LAHELNSVDWAEIEMCSDVEQAWSKFKFIFSGILDLIAPFKEMRLKQRTVPWMCSEILDLIRNRDRFLSKFRKSKLQVDYDKYLSYRNQIKFKKCKAKSDYYVNLVNDNKNQPKKLWQALKSLGTSSNCKTKSNSIGLKIDGNLCFDKSTVAEHFNHFFTTIASTLVNILPAGSGRYGLDFITDFYRSRNVSENVFQLNSVTYDQVYKVSVKYESE